MMAGSLLRRAVACLLIAGLAGCGGGGSTGNVPPPGENPVAGVTSGIAVDPYIVGAKFQEIGADGVAKDNISSATDDKGKFTFATPLTQGSTIQMIVPGLHNGELYTGTLKRKVDVTTGELVSSPITTLLADGVSEDDLTAALGVTKDVLKSNPMAVIDKGGDIGDADLNLLKASILAHAAVQNPTLPLADAVNAVKPIVDQLTASELKTSLTLLNAVVALRDFALENPTVTIVDPVAAVKSVQEAYKGGTGAVTITQTETGLTAEPKTEVVALPTAKDYFDQGMAALRLGLAGSGSMQKIQTAAIKFKTAEVSIDATATQPDKDAILFFSAFSQLATLADTASGDGTGLNRLGDFLDVIGVAEAERNLFQMIQLPQDCQPLYPGSPYLDCQDTVKPIVPLNAKSIQAFLSGKVAPQLQAVVTSLGKVSSGFNYSWADPGDVIPTEIDYADVLVFKAAAQGLLGQINIQQAYNVDVDLYKEQSVDRTTQEFLAAHPDLGNLVDASKLTAAKNFISAGLNDWGSAIAAIENEIDDQNDDLIVFYSLDEQTRAKADLALAKQALAGEITLDDGISKINAAKFFSPGVDLRSKVPVFTGDVPGLFPDATLGGILVSGFELNADLDGDGSPDQLRDFSQLSYGVLAQNYAWEGNYWGMGESGYFILNGTNTPSVADDVVEVRPYFNGPLIATGTWAVVNGKLALTMPQQEVVTLTLNDGFGTYLNVTWSSSTGGSGWGSLYVGYGLQ